jgi:hypothetical protein
MTVAGTLLALFAVVHTVWTGFRASLAAWVAPLAVGLLTAGLWSMSSRRSVPRWATVLLWMAVLALAALLLWSLVYRVTRQNTLV